MAELAEPLILLAAVALGIAGLLFGHARARREDPQERWRQQERRLENEEDTRDQGPI